MNRAEILALYDQQRQDGTVYPGVRREITPYTVRAIDLISSEINGIFYSQLSEDNADAVIAEEIRFFQEIGQDFEWKAHDHDQPPDLKARLARHGFDIGDAEAIMVLDIEQTPDSLLQPIQADVRQITDPDGLAPLRQMLETVWNEDFTGLFTRLESDLRDNPDYLSMFAVYVDDAPVSVAWAGFLPGNTFAGLWGGSTLAAYRGRGFYRALLAARLRAAREKNCRFLTVDAGPMSRPILLRLGFEQISTAYACIWRHAKPEAND